MSFNVPVIEAGVQPRLECEPIYIDEEMTTLNEDPNFEIGFLAPTTSSIVRHNATQDRLKDMRTKE